jgi:hypothetical protein
MFSLFKIFSKFRNKKRLERINSLLFDIKVFSKTKEKIEAELNAIKDEFNGLWSNKYSLFNAITTFNIIELNKFANDIFNTIKRLLSKINGFVSPCKLQNETAIN